MNAQLPPGIELMIDGETVRVQGKEHALVASKSHDGEWHTVDFEDGRFVCTCRGYEIRKRCRHARAITRWMQGEADVRFREDTE